MSVYTVHSKQYRFFKKNPSVLLLCILLGLHGNSTQVFLLNNLYCFECIGSGNVGWCDCGTCKTAKDEKGSSITGEVEWFVCN